MKLVADTSALVSLAATSDARRLALPYFLEGYDVAVPYHVIDELEAVAQYTDPHAKAAQAVLDKQDQFETHKIELDPEFPLDDGENAAIQLTKEIGAAFFYCDEYNQLALIHASLVEPQLVTTPRVLKALVVHSNITNTEAKELLKQISQARSWETNAYVQQAEHLFE
ncbi:hypothetical protein SAMN05421858_3690 [Haladaptatus litoreus]|uniref:PIN domain-containing protein n=1 Tax=Haladaptatus litoreus TaxID=553468 RepID=A0A1N7DK23_9EURY|nr:PIN domain-containing protein [Haladaptatus litoreus]SIR76219.1 hypothetical protein SAMN05421858_3690 [Haladaptatus litoreus]